VGTNAYSSINSMEECSFAGWEKEDKAIILKQDSSSIVASFIIAIDAYEVQGE
jgi:hypothetical protein